MDFREISFEEMQTCILKSVGFIYFKMQIE